MPGTLVSDVPNSDTQEFLKELQRRDVGVAQFHRSRHSGYLMDVIAHIMRVGSVPPSKPVSIPTPTFDRELARQIWQPVAFWANDDSWYCKFTIANPMNKTRLIVGISTPPSGMSVDVNLVTEDCPRLGRGQHKPYQHFCAIGAHRVVEVEYHQAPDCEYGEYIDFKLHRPPGNNAHWLRIFGRGYFYFTAD